MHPDSEIFKTSPENLERAKKGLAPRRFNEQKGKWESMELHHDPAQKDGGLFDITPLWSDAHEAIHYGE